MVKSDNIEPTIPGLTDAKARYIISSVTSAKDKV